MTRILKYNKPEWSYILVGAIAALVMGASTPAFAVIFGEILQVSISGSLFILKN